MPYRPQQAVCPDRSSSQVPIVQKAPWTVAFSFLFRVALLSIYRSQFGYHSLPNILCDETGLATLRVGFREFEPAENESTAVEESSPFPKSPSKGSMYLVSLGLDESLDPASPKTPMHPGP
ncbi:hypothetical protein CGRA01v4_10309 [Colletotrichum graminicola]|nr:hypothetical protein CGRA01v4_10309 [Colletotrichum graminicola]